MASKGKECVCKRVVKESSFVLQCGTCRVWFHGRCVHVPEEAAHVIFKYQCPKCAQLYGPTIVQYRTNWHRQDRYETDADNRPVQTGTDVFVKELKTRHFTSAEGVVHHMRGQQLTLAYLHQNGFDTPILIESTDGLGIKVPPSSFTVRDVEHYVGSEKKIPAIDVCKQDDLSITMRDYANYFYNTMRDKIINIISLEISDTSLNELVQPPHIARKLDWANVWPTEVPANFGFVKPEVQKYCLMSVADSFTDFHIDFGGSSVWYHILKGEKVFYIIRPTSANLALHERWMASATKSETFFGDQVDECFKLVLKAGQTLLMPSGWIHAVLTPVDSLVFGGNFLHSLNIPLQLEIYALERRSRTPVRFRLPCFEALNWFAATKLLQDIKNFNQDGQRCPSHLLLGLKSLLVALKQWSQEKDNPKSTGRYEAIPSIIEPHKLLKDIAKEIRLAEKRISLLNPPKPERESKRQKKKPINKDFVDISQPHSLHILNEVVDKSSRTTPKKVPIKHTSSAVLKPPPLTPLKLTLPRPIVYPYTSSTHRRLSGESKKCKVVVEKMPTPVENNSLKMKLCTRPPSFAGPSKIQKVLQPSDSSLLVTENSLKMEFETKPALNLKLLSDIKIENDIKPLAEVPVTFKNETALKNESVYDFHDDSDDDTLKIDERPKKKKMLSNKYRDPQMILRMKMINSLVDMDVAGEVDVVSESPKNGIEELLKASAYATEPTDDGGRLDVLETGRASPSTREAIAGMLSISCTVVGNQSASKSDAILLKPKRRRNQLTEDYGENIKKVHQDEEYIYPTLDASDDEDAVHKPRSKKKIDEAWSPKARVGPVIPKTDRPVREGTRKQAVEKGLEAAAAKRAHLPAPKRPYTKKRKPAEPQPGCSSMEVEKKKVKKPKKGMATAKQRLGKILKINKILGYS